MTDEKLDEKIARKACKLFAEQLEALLVSLNIKESDIPSYRIIEAQNPLDANITTYSVSEKKSGKALGYVKIVYGDASVEVSSFIKPKEDRNVPS